MIRKVLGEADSVWSLRGCALMWKSSRKSGKVRKDLSGVSLHTWCLLDFTHDACLTSNALLPSTFHWLLSSQSSCLSLIVSISSVNKWMADHAEKINIPVPRVWKYSRGSSYSLGNSSRAELFHGKGSKLLSPWGKPQTFYKEMWRSGWELKKRSKEFHVWVFIQKNWKQGFEEIFTLMFIVAFFTVDKRWKWSKCPFTHEWINNIWYVP